MYSMKKNLLLFLLLLCFTQIVHAQRELVVNTTGYGFDRTAANGIHIEQWAYIQKFFNISSGGQDASVTAVRLYVTWENYEPTLGNYSNSGAKLAQAIAAIIALKPGTKVALHFPYMRNGSWNDSYFADEDIARTSNGTKVQNNIAFTCPSVYSQTAKTRFFAFVNDALNSISAYYSNILYIQMGNGETEEFIIPSVYVGATLSPGFYEDKALQAWRTEYLPCRYPGQSTVVWDGTTQTIATAPAFAPNQYQDWSSDQGREYHRFASWGLMKLYKEFRDFVKSKNASLKVLYYVAYFGGAPGNVLFLSNATLPMGLAESDGIYTTDGIDQYDNLKKIMAIDVIKGTNSSKIAAIEFDPTDLGQPDPSDDQSLINPSIAAEWMARAYKHGVNYVHLAMHFRDGEIEQLKPVLASIKATYLSGSYTPPAHQAPVAENVFPNVFTQTSLFQTTYGNQGGSAWASSDISPISISMNDNDYWQNIWSCTATNPCDFNVSGSGPASSVTAGASVTLSSTCSGQCSGTGYAWSGNGISGSATAVTFNAPSTAGTYTYAVTAAKSGCTSKTANVSVNVTSTGGGGSTCINLADQCSGNEFEIRSYSLSLSTGGTIPLTIKYRAHERPSILRMRINNGSWQNFNVGQTNYSGQTFDYVDFNLGSFALNSGNNSFDFASDDGFICYRELCAGSGGGCTTPPAPSLSTSPSSITSGSSSTLTASGCSGGTITWSNGLGTGTSKTVSPTTTTTYTATCTIGSCTSVNGSVTVTVTSTGGGGSTCINLADQCSGNEFEIRSYSLSLSTGGTIPLTIKYRAHERPSILRMRINNGSWQNFNVGQTNYSGQTFDYVDFNLGSFALNSGNNSFDFASDDGFICYRELCAGSGGGCTTPPAPSLSTSPSSITSGSSSTLTASGCSGGTITWSNGLGTGTSKTVSPTTTTTYTATCTIGSCTSVNGSVTVTVTSGGGPNCGTLSSNFDGVTCSFIEGWIYDQSSPNTAVNVDIYDGATLILSNVAAGTFRQDLLNAGFGNGAHGFTVATPEQLKNGQTHTVTIKASGCNYQLNSSPKTVTCASSLTLDITPTLKLTSDETVALNRQTGLIVTPNPNNGVFETSFFIQKGKKATILVTDLQGRTIYRKTITGQGAHRERLDLSSASSGTLFIQLKKEDKTEVQKISVVR